MSAPGGRPRPGAGDSLGRRAALTRDPTRESPDENRAAVEQARGMNTSAHRTRSWMPSPTVAVPRRLADEMTGSDAALFHRVRPRLFGIAYRVLGSASEADDVVQDAWLRWQRTDRRLVRNAPAFLATTTARLAINVGQSARARHETDFAPATLELTDAGADPSRDAEHREALEHAMQTLLQKLSPSERAAYVLREAFDYPYRRVSQTLALSEENARQLVTRARRRLCGDHRRPVRPGERRRLVDAFVAAARTGDLAPLERLLVMPLEEGACRVAA